MTATLGENVYIILDFMISDGGGMQHMYTGFKKNRFWEIHIEDMKSWRRIVKNGHSCENLNTVYPKVQNELKCVKKMPLKTSRQVI